MLPKVHRQRYQELKQALEQLQQIKSGSSPVSPEGGTEGGADRANLDGAALREAVGEVQQFFQGQVLSLPLDELEPASAPLVRSYQTEIHKQLRLLMTDVMFVQAARQPATLVTRLSGVGDRIQILIGYCEAVLK